MVFGVDWQWTLQYFSPFSTGQVQGAFLQVSAALTSASLTVSSAIFASPVVLCLKRCLRFYAKSRAQSRKEADRRRLQVLPQEADDLPGVEVDPGALAAGVVTAGEPGDVDGDARGAHPRDHLVREVGGEGQVVARGDEAHRAAAQGREPPDVAHRADGQPDLAQLFDRERAPDPGAHVPRRDAAPDHVGDVAGDVVEDARVDALVVDEGEEGGARADARPHRADALVPLGVEPRDGRARVDDGLP